VAQVVEGLGGAGPWLGAGHTVRRLSGACMGDDEMTTNLHDKMLAAIDAYFSASNEIEAHVAEEQLLDVRDEINKQPSQPSQQEPVAEVVQAFADLTAISWKHNGGRFPPIGTKLYTAPQPQSSKPWVGLTDEEVINVMPDDDNPMSLGEAFCKFAVLLEAKLKEKNT